MEDTAKMSTELSHNSGIQEVESVGSAGSIRMEEMTWPDIKFAIEQGYTTVVVGVGR